MSDQLSYDPRSKKIIKDALYEFLYTPVEEHFQKRLDTIITGNSNLKNNSQKHLIFRGDIYATRDAGAPIRPINFCHPDVQPLMKEYVDDLNHLNNREMPHVLNYFNKVLNSSENLVDYFKLLPESVHGPLKKLSCPCTVELLKDDRVTEIQQQHQEAIALIKQRMVENLLL